DDTCTLVKETRRFFESSLLVMWREFDDEQQHLEDQHQQGGQLQQPPSMRVSLSTFVRLRPPWVARLTASQRQVCVCKTCCNLDNLLTALAQHKKSLQLPPAAAIAAPLAAPLATVGAAPQPPPHQGGDAPPVAEEEDESLTAAASPYIDPLGEFEQQEHRWQAEQERQPWQAAPPFHPSHLPPPLSPPLYTPGLPPVPLHSPPPLPPHSPILIPPPPSKTQPLSATAMRQLFLCPCELGQQPGLACSLRTCPHCKSRKLQLQPDADGSVMLTVRQYGKPSSAVGSRPAPAAGKAKVELLCMRVSLSDVVGMLNKQMPEYIRHHRLAHHQLQVFREHREAVKAGQDGKVVISCDWSEKLTVERSVEIMSEHWHAQQIGILVACAYFKNKEGVYKEHTVYVMTDGKEQSAAITQAAVNQVVCYLLAEHDMDMRQLYMWSDGCAGQFKGAPAMRQHWGMAQRFSMPVWWSYGATAHFKGRHDSEGGVVKQWLRGEILADRVGKCNALGFVQHCNAYHKPAAAADPSKAHRARASVGHRWCLELSTREVELCSAPQRDAHAFASSIPGSMSMHSCFFPAAGIQVEWSETACACAQCMTPAPRGVCMRPSITKPFVAMPMFDQKRDDKHWDDECLTLLCSFAPDSVKQLCTLGKKLSVKMLNEYCKAVGLYVPANTLRADLRYMCTAAENSASRVVGVVRQHLKGPSRRAEPFACQACNRAREYGVLHDPFALCHLIRAFVLPLGLYGSQVWGTAFLGHGVQLSNPVQTRMLSFLRFAARVRSSVSGLMVLHELGQLPLQLYWFRAACKFWNTAKLSHSDLLMRVIKADVELGRSCQASWSAQFQLAARELMGDEFTLSPDMVLGTKAMEVKWLERWGRRWVGFEGDPRLPETVHRERCSYAAWFKHGDGIGINHMAPHLLNRQLSTEVRTSLTRFRLGNSGLGVEKARFEGVTFIDRTCTRCTEGVVDDAMHFIFECTATSSIREQPEFAMTLQNNNENLHDFMLSPCAPLFVHLAMKCVTESPEPLEGEGGLAA
ncbi:hypothetical protein QJQ45_024803, partial [Haematococcus lacustris]